MTDPSGKLYGGFPMPGDNFFYLSSMYSDRLLTEFLPRIKNRSYQRYLEIQKNIMNGNEIIIALEDDSTHKYFFKTSDELDEAFEFPTGSLYADITEQGFYLDICDKLKFIKKFKSFTAPISSLDIIQNPEIFTHVIRCMIGDFAFNKFYILQDKYHRIYVAIKNSSKDGISNTVWNRLISDNTSDPITMTLWKDQPSVIYNYTGTLNTYASSVSGMVKFKVQTSTNITPLRPLDENNWTLLVTYDNSKYSQNIYGITDVTLDSSSKSELVFNVSKAFIDDIASRNSIVSCVVFQRLNRKSIYSYTPNDDSEPWLALGDVDKPVSIANVKIYSYDETTNRYGRRIPIETNNFNSEFNEKVTKENYNENDFSVNVIFPSIYNFTTITKPVRIELIEYNTDISNTEFDNHIKFVFGNSATPPEYSSNNYLQYLSNLKEADNQEKLNILTKFNPIDVYMDYRDYLDSGFSSMRQYKFSKLMELIKSDPYIYAEYVKFMDEINYGIIHETGSAQHFKFNTGLSGKYMTGNNPVVTDDGFTCINKNDDVFFFDEPHSYIKVHCDNPDALCLVYVKGRLIPHTRIKSVMNDIYIFISQSKMANYLTEKSSDELMGFHDYITVMIYSKVNRSTVNQVHDTLSFDSMSSSLKLFDGDEDFKYSLNDLVICNKTTGKYIPLSKFNITASLQQATIEFDDGNSESIVGTNDDITYLGTHAGEYYMTKDNYRIILDESTQDIQFPTDDEFGRDNNYKGYLNKIWSANDLKFTLSDSSLIGSEIEIIYSPVGYYWNIENDRLTFDENGNASYRLGNFIGNNNSNDFELYYNGELITDNSCVTMPNGISTNEYIYINIPHEYIDNLNYTQDTGIQLIYNPTKYTEPVIINSSNYHDIGNYRVVDKTVSALNSETSKIAVSPKNNIFNTYLYEAYTAYNYAGISTFVDKYYDIQNMYNFIKTIPFSIGAHTLAYAYYKNLERDYSYYGSGNMLPTIIDQLVD